MVGHYPTIYFAFQTGCSACRAAEPHLEAWRKQNGYRWPVIRLNVGLKDWEIGGWSPRATPGYLLMHGGSVVAVTEGTMTTEELQKWIDRSMSGGPLPDDPVEPEEEDEAPPKKGRRRK